MFGYQCEGLLHACISSYIAYDLYLITGIIFFKLEPILVITEFCVRGNLRHLLRKSRIPVENDDSGDSTEYKNIFSTLCHRKLLQIAADIANGMQHLAAHEVLILALQIYYSISEVIEFFQNRKMIFGDRICP